VYITVVALTKIVKSRNNTTLLALAHLSACENVCYHLHLGLIDRSRGGLQNNSVWAINDGFSHVEVPKRKPVNHAVFCLPLGYGTPISRHGVRFSVVSFELIL